MKKLLFAIIAGLLFSCTNPTEPTANAPVTPPINPSGKITTLMFRYNAPGGIAYAVLHSKTTPDTIVPAYQDIDVRYQKVDSIWGFLQNGNTWTVKTNNGGSGNVYSSGWGHTFIKLWRL